MQCKDATIKQSGRDEMRQGAQYNDDVTMRRRDDETHEQKITAGVIYNEHI